jgi:hypothetical protein
MNHLTHLLRADVRRFRALIALWIVVAAAGVALDAVAPFAYQRIDSMRGLFFAARLIQLADALLALAVVALAVQTHPAVGSDAFWMTRPIRHGSLLRSKLLLLVAVLVAVPVACEAVFMRAYDVPTDAMVRAAAQMFLLRAAGLLVVMALAALTPNVGRFALVGGAVLLATAVGATGIDLIRGATGAQRTGIWVYEPGALGVAAGDRDGTAALAAWAILIGSALAVLAFHYRVRSVLRSATMGVCGAVFAVAIALVWPWTLLAVQSGVETEATRSVRLTGAADPLYFEPLKYGPEADKWRRARADVRTQGVPAGWVAAATLLRASIEVSGRSVASPGQASSSLLSFADRGVDAGPLTVATREVLGVERMAIGPRGGPGAAVRGSTGRTAVFLVQRRDTSLDTSATGTYRGEFAIALTQMEVVASFPVTARAAFQDGGFGLAIDDIVEEESRLRIRGRTFWVRTVLDRTPRSSFKFFIRNRARGEASDLDTYHRSTLTWGPWLRTSGFESFATDLIFRWQDAGLERLDGEWLKGAELVVVRSTYRGSVMRTLEMSGVKISGE